MTIVKSFWFLWQINLKLISTLQLNDIQRVHWPAVTDLDQAYWGSHIGDTKKVFICLNTHLCVNRWVTRKSGYHGRRKGGQGGLANPDFEI